VYVVKVIERIPNVGKVKARRILSELDISERCHVGDLTPLQRSTIVDQVARS
jgi:ribosomal protein S13